MKVAQALCLPKTIMSGTASLPTIVHQTRRYGLYIDSSGPACEIRDAADRLGLKRIPPEGTSEDVFSIWDGSNFVFQSSPWKLISLWRLIHRYYLMYFKFQTPKYMLNKFLKLYDLQSQGQSFETPEAFLQELDLYSLTQTSMRAHIKVCYVSKRSRRHVALQIQSSSVPQALLAEHGFHAPCHTLLKGAVAYGSS